MRRREFITLLGGAAAWPVRQAAVHYRRSTDGVIETASMKKPGAVSRPGTAREFQFREWAESRVRVKD
jgi:hypothetical protein